MTLTLNPAARSDYSGALVVGDQTVTLAKCPGEVNSRWAVDCQRQSIRISGLGLSDVPQLTISLADLDGRPLAQDQVVPLGPLKVDTTDDGVEMCERQSQVPLQVPTAPILTATPSILSFGEIPLGTTSAHATVAVTNDSVRRTGSPRVTVTGPFLVRIDCLDGIPAHGTCTMDVAYRAVLPGAEQGTVVLGANPGGEVSVQLAGTGVAARPDGSTPGP